jgi:quercetin dioxygenase-like cupin family protein
MHRSLVLVLFTAIFAAQSAPEVEITAEPHHHLTLTNDYVRVFYVDVPAGESTLTHWHHHDYIYVTLGDAELTNEVVGKPPVNLRLTDGETRLSPGPFAHLVRIAPGKSFRNVTIELLQDEKLRKSSEHWDPSHPDEDRGLEILEGGTKEILWVKDGVRATEFELQPGGVAPLSANPQLFVPVTDVALMRQGVPNAPHSLSMDIDRRSGEALWLQDKRPRLMKNRMTIPAKFITLEFH